MKGAPGIFEDAKGLSFPRYPGTEGDSEAISWLEQRLGDVGFDTSLQWFTYDIGPAQRTLRAVLTASALLVAAAGLITPSSPPTGLAVLAAALVPGVIFLAWAPWLERLYRREGGTRTANVIGRRGATAASRMTLMLMAHHDSKSQSLTFPFRMGLTIFSISGALIVMATAAAFLIFDSGPSSGWVAPVSGIASAVAALVLATMTSGNRSPGGVDNAGSVAIMLAVGARLRDDLPPETELVVLSTGAEEDHMVGAMRWLDEFADAVVRPVYCLNFDGAGAPGRAVLIERFGFGRLFSAEMSAAARRAAAKLGIKPRGIVMLPGMGIDSIPFAHREIPCLTLSSGSLGRATMSVHSANDVADNLDPGTLAEIADLAYETMMDLSRR
jgi:acetylornithine deacetylase/succinyl-diaminopimelate desuccinylase-like protein